VRDPCMHNLKCWPEYFPAVLSGEKPFELRFNDRDFRVGDGLRLQEFEPCHHCKGRGRVHLDLTFSEWINRGITEGPCLECAGTCGKYTGRLAVKTITYVLANCVGLREGHVILGMRNI
jgi:hypothetical protein